MDFNLGSWNSDDMNRLYLELHNMADEKYCAFNEKIIKTNKPMIGIRMPDIKKCAKQIAKGNAISFLENISSACYESTMLKGLVIAYAKISYEEFLNYSDRFMNDIENWAICDCFCGAISLGKHKEDYFKYIEKYLLSKNPWCIRVGLVIMLGKYLDDDHIDEVLNRCDHIKSSQYYVRMAQAWLVSTALVKEPQITLDYLKTCHLDDWTYNKTISKANDSFRISDTDKKLLNSMRRK